MAASRRLYLELSRQLKEVKPEDDRALIQWGRDVRRVAVALAFDNANFDRHKFYAACDYDG